MFYKLDKSKKYGVEGTNNKIGSEILFYVVLFIFWGIAVAAAALNFNILFAYIGVTVFILTFVVILSVISAIFFMKAVPVYKKRINARRVLHDCILTDGTVTAVNEQKMWHHGEEMYRNYSYCRVLMEYSYVGFDGALRCGRYAGNYGENPFYIGQNLMIAFNDTDSIIMNKFTLSDGAEDFAKAEEQREQADFKGLTGKLINVNLSEPVSIADYDLSLINKAKKRKKLQQILQDYPRFTVGRFFVKKCTYRYKAGNKRFYCYISENGKKYVEECARIYGIKDGDEVTVAYSGGNSEIVSNYALKLFPKPRRKKSV